MLRYQGRLHSEKNKHPQKGAKESATSEASRRMRLRVKNENFFSVWYRRRLDFGAGASLS